MKKFAIRHADLFAIIAIIFTMVIVYASFKEKEKTDIRNPAIPGAVVMDSLHEKDCYHGYILLPNGNQLVDATGHTVPCSN